MFEVQEIMKFIKKYLLKFVFLSVITFQNEAMASRNSGGFLSTTAVIIFSPWLLTNASIGFSAISVKELTNKNSQTRYSFMVETSPLAANFLDTGKGLENPALALAMYLVGGEDQSNDFKELALRIIEEANGKYQNESVR